MLTASSHNTTPTKSNFRVHLSYLWSSNHTQYTGPKLLRNTRTAPPPPGPLPWPVGAGRSAQLITWHQMNRVFQGDGILLPGQAALTASLAPG